jgi:hypothetical protein
MDHPTQAIHTSLNYAMQWCTQRQVRGITLGEATFGSLSILLTLLNPKKLTILVCVIGKPKDPTQRKEKGKSEI